MIVSSFKLMLLRDVAQRFVHGNRNTWIALAIGLLVALLLMLWIVASALGWVWGQGRSLVDGAPQTARIVAEQVAQAVPGVQTTLEELVPALKLAPPRDVSGTDIGPVARFPGLARSHWHRDDREVTVRYEGRAEYAEVLDHYVKSFVAQGYAQIVMTASPGSESHEYRKGTDWVRFKISQLPKGEIKVSVISELR